MRELSANVLILEYEYMGAAAMKEVIGLFTRLTRPSHQRIQKMELPKSLENAKDKVLSSLKEALVAHKDNGIYSRNTSYEIQLDY